jgi:hypothetical protein
MLITAVSAGVAARIATVFGCTVKAFPREVNVALTWSRVILEVVSRGFCIDTAKKPAGIASGFFEVRAETYPSP